MRSKLWTTSEVEHLKHVYPNTTNKKLALKFKRTPNSIHHKAKSLGLLKSEAHKTKMAGFSGSVLKKYAIANTKSPYFQGENTNADNPDNHNPWLEVAGLR